VHFITNFLQSLFHTEVLRYVEIVLIYAQSVSKPHQFTVNFLASIACIVNANLLQLKRLRAIDEDNIPEQKEVQNEVFNNIQNCGSVHPCIAHRTVCLGR